ncbi:dihydroorotase [Candidatus Gracilibacteria bacterium]|nr:dihydroorotase [Candidatus Gracilibacteria bacterium]
MKILLKNGEVVSSDGVEEVDVLIEDGKIVEILKRGEFEGEAEEIDCLGKMVLPGFIDAHVHFRDFEQAYKEDWTSGSRAAVAGGVTTVLDMPNNSPPIITFDDLENKRKHINGKTYCNYGLYMGANGSNIEDIKKVKNVPAVKIYCAHSTGKMGVSGSAIEQVFKETDKRIVVHAEDEEIVSANTKKYLKENSDVHVHSKIRSVEAAVSEVKKVCALSDKYSNALHIAHVSTEAELEVIAQHDGVTCEVAPHHLIISEDDYEYYGNYIRVNPPVRSRQEVFSLWKAVKMGMVDIIATDHATHTPEEKERPYNEAPSGIPEVETTLPIMMNMVNDEAFYIEEVVAMCCERPAKIFGIENKGKIEVGYDADIVVVDMEEERKLENENLFTKCGWSPYSGSSFKGWPVMTFVNGQMVFKDGKIVGKPQGQEAKFI